MGQNPQPTLTHHVPSVHLRYTVPLVIDSDFLLTFGQRYTDMTVCHALNFVMYQAAFHILNARRVRGLGAVDTVDSIQLPDDRLGRARHVRKQDDVASRFVLHRFEDDAINTRLAVVSKVASDDLGGQYCRSEPGSTGTEMML